MYDPIGGELQPNFDLRREPDGVNRVDGRVIPIADNTAGRINDGKSVVPIHMCGNSSIGSSWATLGADVEQ